MIQQTKAALSKLNAARKSITIERIGRIQSVALIGGYALLVVSDPAMAQSLRSTGESIFNTLYGIVGVVGGIASLGSAMNWKAGNFLGARDPKQTFINSLIGTGLAFGTVGIIQFIKGAVGTNSGISGV